MINLLVGIVIFGLIWFCVYPPQPSGPSQFCYLLHSVFTSWLVLGLMLFWIMNVQDNSTPEISVTQYLELRQEVKGNVERSNRFFRCLSDGKITELEYKTILEQ